jgi:hypothetical protein
MREKRPSIETVQHGYKLVDCPTCGVIGVWQTGRLARMARDTHHCGEPTTTPGKVGPLFIVGPRPTGHTGDDT